MRERAFVPRTFRRCLAIGAVSDPRLTNWYFPEIIAYYIGNNFHPRPFNREYETIALPGAKMREGVEVGINSKRGGSKRGVASCANDNYFAAFRQHINLSMRTRRLRHSLSTIIDFFRVYRLYNGHLAFYVAC